jgi:threonine synthase
VLTDFFNTGVYDRNRALITTISPSMDIQISSNLERLLYYITGGDGVRVRRYMGSLNKEGKYQIDNGLMANLGAVFAADTAARRDKEGNKQVSDRTVICSIRIRRSLRRFCRNIGKTAETIRYA